MHQEGIGDPAQAFQRFVIANHQRLAMRVGAGHYQQQIVGKIEPVAAGGPAGSFVPEQ